MDYKLQRKYQMSEDEMMIVYKVLKKDLVQRKPINLRVCNIIVGQFGTGKKIYSEYLACCDNTQIVVSDEVISWYHPHLLELRTLYPDTYLEIIQKDINAIRKRLLTELIQDGYSINFETSCLDISEILRLIDELKLNGYDINISVLAINYLESCIKMLEEFIAEFKKDKTGIIADAYLQRKSFENIRELVSWLRPSDYTKLMFLDHNFASYSSNYSEVSEDVLEKMRSNNDGDFKNIWLSRLENIKVEELAIDSDIPDELKDSFWEQMDFVSQALK